MSTYDRADTFRWGIVNGRHDRPAHLWLGQETACGQRFTFDGGRIFSLDMGGSRQCSACAAYARGWLDRHDHGSRPELGQPDPLGHRGRLEVTS